MFFPGVILLKGYWKAALAAVYVAGLMAFPDAALAAARGAMANWAASVAPALFPFAAVLPFLTCKEAREIYDRLLGWLLRGVFRLPGSCASALVTGLLGGSPAGAMAVGRVAAEVGLTRGQAARLAGISCGMGPVYVVSALGVALKGSAGVGYRLLAAQWGGMFLTGLLFRRAWAGETAPWTGVPSANEAHPIAGAALAMLKVCGYMTLFSVGMAMARAVAGPWVEFVSPFLELPTGAAFWAERGLPECILAGALGFGGCCVILQNAAFGVPLGRYVLQKTVTAALAAGIYLLLERAFPGDVPTFSGDSAEKQGLVWVICMLPVAVFFLKNLFLNNSNSRDFREKTAKNRNI